MTSKLFKSVSFEIERIEPRVLFSAIWGPTATLVDQGTAAAAYPSINGSGVTVAEIDSGIDYNLPQLGGGFGAGHKVIAGFDFVNNDSDPIDTFGHGTEVAGVIAADPFTFNGLRYSGVAPSAKLVALKVTDGEDGASDANIAKALEWIIANYKKYSISVVNISLGSGSYATTQNNPTLSDDFAAVAKLNIAVFAASGNSGGDAFGSQGVAYPAADPSVISVGAVNPSDVISTFTQRGSILDLLAPGEAIPSTTINGDIASVDGTSFSSPYAAGLAALIEQANPGVSKASLLSVLRASGKSNLDGDVETGNTSGLFYPRIDILNALKLVAARKVSSKNKVGTSAVSSDIAYDDQGILYLAYYDPSIRSIRFATRDTNGLWSRTSIVDSSRADVGVYVSIAIDSTGKPGIAYFDNTNSDLKYAHFNGATWDVSTLDSSKSVGQFPSLAYDNDGNPAISYYRKSGGDLKFTTTDSNGKWSFTNVDTTGDVGAWTSISVAQTAGVIAIAYVDQTNGDLKYARVADGVWTLFTVDDLTGVAYTSLNIHNNQAFISYQDLTTGDLKFAERTNGQFETETVYQPANTGSFSNLIFDSNDQAHIAFYSKSKNLAYEAVGTFGSFTVTRIATGGSWISAAASPDGDLLAFVGLDASKKDLLFGTLS